MKRGNISFVVIFGIVLGIIVTIVLFWVGSSVASLLPTRVVIDPTSLDSLDRLNKLIEDIDNGKETDGTYPFAKNYLLVSSNPDDKELVYDYDESFRCYEFSCLCLC